MNEQKKVDLLEGIKREMELQNDLKMYDMLENEPTDSRHLVEESINNISRGKLYARLSDEDRSIIERYRKPNGSFSKELDFYNMTVKGFPLEYGEKKIQCIIGKMLDEILNDVYTEKELYEYFERVFERTDFVLSPLEYYWEKAWQRYKEKVINEDFEGSLEGFILGIYDEEEWEKRRQEKMEEYENRITKAYAEEQKQYE